MLTHFGYMLIGNLCHKLSCWLDKAFLSKFKTVLKVKEKLIVKIKYNWGAVWIPKIGASTEPFGEPLSQNNLDGKTYQPYTIQITSVHYYSTLADFMCVTFLPSNTCISFVVFSDSFEKISLNEMKFKRVFLGIFYICKFITVREKLCFCLNLTSVSVLSCADGESCWILSLIYTCLYSGREQRYREWRWGHVCFCCVVHGDSTHTH